jgi:hypothetical protein
VAALSLCDDLDGPVGSSIAASAARAFDELRVVASESLGFGVLYATASGPLPFSIAAVTAAMEAADPLGGRLYGDAATRLLARTAEPLSEDHLTGVLMLGQRALLSLRTSDE